MYIVELYTSPNGKAVVKKILDDSSKQHRSKILKAIAALKEFGISRDIPNIGTKLWEYRILGNDNIRIILVSIINGHIMILNIFVKKSQKTPIKELNIAISRYKTLLDM
jgi:phage-related protein